MPVTVVVGGQFGSEGKGKVACEFARMRNAAVAVRTGGSNSGHTVIDHLGETRVFRHLPTAAILDNVICAIGAGTYVDVEVLLAEIEDTHLGPDRLLVDPSAVVISESHKQAERSAALRERIGSTGSGTGAAVVDRISRSGFVQFAKDDERLKDRFVRPVVPFLREQLRRNKRVIIEGTQGFGLSVLHSQDYPYVTSRDTTAAAFVSEAGLSPLDVDEVVLVIRAFPIRVSGNSGDLPNEIDWETVTRECNSPVPIIEKTTVTQCFRRIGRFDSYIVKRSIEANMPTNIVLNHLDYIDALSREINAPTHRVDHFIDRVQWQLGFSVQYMGFGPNSMISSNKNAYALTAI